MAEGNTLSGVNVVLVMAYGSLVSTKLHSNVICIIIVVFLNMQTEYLTTTVNLEQYISVFSSYNMH